jgi:uncharacterized Rossmann fold enzyme
MAKSMHLPLLKKKGKFNDRRMTIACYGPSLEDTWRQLKHPIMTVSGAHDYLVERGVIPDFHVDCDPRAHKAEMLRKPQKETPIEKTQIEEIKELANEFFNEEKKTCI